VAGGAAVVLGLVDGADVASCSLGATRGVLGEALLFGLASCFDEAADVVAAADSTAGMLGVEAVVSSAVADGATVALAGVVAWPIGVVSLDAKKRKAPAMVVAATAATVIASFERALRSRTGATASR